MVQCQHVFEVDKSDGQVRCKICKDLDDEMELTIKEESSDQDLDDFYKTQINFE